MTCNDQLAASLYPSPAMSQVLVRGDVRTFDEPIALTRLAKALCRPVRRDDSVFDSERVVAVVIGDDRFNADDAREFPHLRVIARLAADLSNVAVGELQSMNIKVCSTRGANARATGEFAFAAAMMLLRDLPYNIERMRDLSPGNITERRHAPGVELSDAVVGVIGRGATAQVVTKLARSCGAQVLAWNRTWDSDDSPEFAGVEKLREMRDLLGRAHVISLHVSIPAGDPPILDSRAFELIGQAGHEPVVVNTGRAHLIDDAALLAALDTGVVRGAALDVWHCEGDADRAEVEQKLRAHEFVLPTPHIAGHTDRSRKQVQIACAQSVVDALNDANPRGRS